MRFTSMLCSILLAGAALEGSAVAATPGHGAIPAARIWMDFSSAEERPPAGIRMPHVSFAEMPRPRVSVPRVVSGRWLQAQTAPAAPTRQKLPQSDQVVIGVLGGVGGFFGGAAIGYGIDRHLVTPHGGGDDPGMTGFLVGALIGAIALPVILLTWLGR